MKNRKSEEKIKLVVGIDPKSYRVTDTRLNKPLCSKQVADGVETGSMLVQDIDDVRIGNSRLTYFTPNNVAILLSVPNKSLAAARTIFKEKFDPTKSVLDFQEADKDKRAFLDTKSQGVCDYIEAIQVNIIFGYTAVEAFTNLSIPSDYVYQVEIKSRGTVELHDKDAIERWISLKDKILYILPDIYNTPRPDKKNFWGHFAKLEKYRNDITHQKTINSTAFYKAYFQRDIFDVCGSAEQIIRFFYNQHAMANRTNPLWPWLINSENHIPVSYDYDPSKVEVIGNLYEGYTRKPKRQNT
jgi:hypothetical protein